MEDQFRAICGSPIWNTKAVYSSFPDFTDCFQYTILKWIPCAVLWLCAPIWTYMLTRRVQFKLKFSLLSLLKIITTMFLLSIELFYLMKAIHNSKYIVYYMTPLISISTYILILFFNQYERLRGLRSSMLLFTFWILQVLCSTITFRSRILHHIHYKHGSDLTEVYLFYVFYALCIFELILCTFSEKFSDKNYRKSQNARKMTPENLTPLLSKLTFLWIDPLIRKGFRRSLIRSDVWEIDSSESSEQLTEKFEREWNKHMQKYNRSVEENHVAAHNNNNNINNNTNKKVTAMYKTTTKNNEEELILNNAVSEMDVKAVKHSKEPSLIWCLCKVFGGKFLAGTLLKLASDLLSFASPILLDVIIKFINDPEQTMSVGIFLTILLFLSSISQSLLLQHYYFRSYLVGARIRTALVNLIYKKTFRLSTQSRNSSTGTVTNLVAVNAQLFLTITAFLNMLWSSPFQIVVCIYMLWRYLGIAAIAGLATTIIFIPLNVIAANLNKTLNVKKLTNQDLRLKLINEILNGIKVIKFYGWEISFQKIVDKVRNEEMRHFTKFALVGIIQSFTWASAPFFVAAVSYATFILTTSKNLDPSTAFVSFTLFYLIRFPLALLPQTIAMLIQGYVALKRIKSFLLLEETNENDIKRENTGDVAIMMKNVYVGWEKNVPFLCNLNLEIKKKKLYAVVGGIGSGKSSLLSSLLGEMYKLNEGKINVNGTVAYVSQQAWIQNSTVRDNILFGRDFNELYYNRVITACSLLPDFDIMPLRDKTEIGERGINLSGGQKQRISLARALYAKADIYLLDDPLSAVDAHVGKSIFDNVIGPNGLLKNKTRLFVTNSLCFLPQVDQIIMLDNGTIAEMGAYDELREKDGVFAEFIRIYLENSEINRRNMESIEAQVQEKRENIEEDTLTEITHHKPLLPRQDSLGSHYGSDFFHNVRLNHNTGTTTRGDGGIIDKENIQSGTIKLSVLVDYMKKSGIPYTVVFYVLFLLSNVALSASSFWLSAWSNDTVDKSDPGKADRLKYFRLTVYLILGLVQCVLLNISNVFLVLMYLRAARLYHNKLLRSILRSTLHFFESTPIGRIINRFSRDIEALETAIPDSFKICLFCLSNIIHTFIILAYTTPFSLLLILPSTIIYIFIQRYYVSSARQLTRLDSTTKSPIFSHLSETFSGVSTIRAYRAQPGFVKRMQKYVDENTVYLYTGNCAERWLIIRLDFIANLITALASLFAVFSRNALSPGLVGLSISLSITVSQALNFFVKMGAEFEANVTAVERIKEYFTIPHEAAWSIDSSKSPVTPSWPNEGRVEFREYSAKYSKNSDYVLNEINAVILPGEKVGIVGRTGAGKSSLTLALFRLMEITEGDIIIDDVNINKIGLHDLRHKITIIPQDPIIFSGTIRMNLDPFEKHTDDEIWTSLELAHLKDFLVNTEEKLDFECKEDGKNLSLGQRQLICLARALLRKNKILILDEATAAVDHNTDELIQQTIRTEFKDCTVITIAHRLNTIMDSSRIMVLDKGRIVEFDSPENLLANKDGYFFSMSKDANLIK